MKHSASSRFWASYDSLPEAIRRVADKNFDLLKSDPGHPSLYFKKIAPYYSVRVGRHYRALGTEAPDGVLWFWIGTHADYDRMIG